MLIITDTSLHNTRLLVFHGYESQSLLWFADFSLHPIHSHAILNISCDISNSVIVYFVYIH